MPNERHVNLISNLLRTVEKLTDRRELDQIPTQRRLVLESLAEFVRNKVSAGDQARLNFVCTHNSRRSHIAQIWAQAASWYYGIPGVVCFSGGTEATAFNPKAVNAMREAGFLIKMRADGGNPIYDVKFAEDADPVIAFSKRYDHKANPASDFAAIMTCSHADENCPVISGASVRIAVTYDDPKDFDGTALEAKAYTDRVNQIGREMLFAFSKVRR